MTKTDPYSTIEELPDFDIEFPEDYDIDDDDFDLAEEVDLDFDDTTDNEDDWPEQDNFPFHELDDLIHLG